MKVVDVGSRDEGVVPGTLVGGRYEVVRAWPGTTDIIIEATDAAGRITPGRLGRDDEIEMFPPGIDSALPGLEQVIDEGAQLIGHRFGRRAVVRMGERFVKIVRPRRVEETAERHRIVERALNEEGRNGGFSVPRLIDVEPSAGTLTFVAIDGAPMMDDAVGIAAVTAVTMHRFGAALGSFSTARPSGLPEHSAGDEAAVINTWRESAYRFETIPDGLVERYEELVDQVTDQLHALANPRRSGLSHRDLHDGQVLIRRDGGFGLLDLDTASLADPAVDVGNLLAHLDLAVHQGRIPMSTLPSLADGFLAGVGIRQSDQHALGVYRLASVLRLVAVHSFRPRTRAAALDLLVELAADHRVGSTKR